MGCDKRPLCTCTAQQNFLKTEKKTLKPEIGLLFSKIQDTENYGRESLLLLKL